MSSPNLTERLLVSILEVRALFLCVVIMQKFCGGMTYLWRSSGLGMLSQSLESARIGEQHADFFLATYSCVGVMQNGKVCDSFLLNIILFPWSRASQISCGDFSALKLGC